MTEFSAKFIPVRVTPGTIWLFVSLSDGENVGWGEATLDKQEEEVAAHFRNLPVCLTDDHLADLRFDTLPQAALSSALRQAEVDLKARKEGLSLSAYLGGTVRKTIGLYANINRCTRDRSPSGMAASATRALGQGHSAIKIAPFDEVQLTQSRQEMANAMEQGLARIAAVRDVIGDRRLMVDCHWRFDVAGARELIDACVPFNLHWIECPISESEVDIPAIVSLRRQANARDVRLAGLETAIQKEGFAPYLTAGAYDVMMPDVKYCGGPREMLAIAADMQRHGVTFSPHNPTGPICHVHSLNICATLAECDLLETQFDETPMFDKLIDRPLPQPTEGHVALPAAEPGLGVSLIMPKHGARV